MRTPLTRHPTTLAAALLTTLTLTLLPTAADATGDTTTQPGETCPNETLTGFTPTLPECRAYEMITPPYEAGESPEVLAVSTDGTHLIYINLGNYSGSESNYGDHGSPYIASRTATGWSNLPLSPPTSEYPGQEYLTATADLSRSLWRVRTAGESDTAEDLYLREANGNMIKIGSLVPPATEQGPPAGGTIHLYWRNTIGYLDASSDLSHVFFGFDKYAPLWPFDTTIPTGSRAASLYEYSGTNVNQPSLVGVSDGHTTLRGLKTNPGDPNEPLPDNEVLAPGSLISDCWTQLGAKKGDGYNTVSADGNIVFFTATGTEDSDGRSECYGELVDNSHYAAHAPLVNELYARVDGKQTIPISEPTTGHERECRECQTGERERAAEFVGASENGSKVFFTSEQEYFPGETGKNLFEYELNAPPGYHLIPVSANGLAERPEVLGIARISEDGTHTYFVATGKLATNTNAYSRTAKEGQPNLYLFLQNATYPQGKITFITPLSTEDRGDWEAHDVGRHAQATPDGRFLVFMSWLNLASGGELVEGQQQVFEYSAETGELVQVSTGEKGFTEGDEDAANAGAGMTGQNYGTESKLMGPVSAGAGALSRDGFTVLFGSYGALTREALDELGTPVSTEREPSLYVFHSPGGVLSKGAVSLVAPHGSGSMDTSADNIFVQTSRRLVPSDTDEASDLYDARVDGGVPEAPISSLCGGEGCLSPASGGPPLVPVASSSVPGSGNLAAPVPTVPFASAGDSPVLKPATRAVKLASALRTCRKSRVKAKRLGCERATRKRYRVVKTRD